MPARQMHLFHGKEQRGTAPPPPSEFAAQCFLVIVIKRWIDPRWRFTHIASGEYRDPITAGRLQRLGVVSGFPDLMFLGPGPRVVFLELKRRGGRLSPAQQITREHLEDCGFDYLCTDSPGQAIAWLKNIGILHGGFEVQ